MEKKAKKKKTTPRKYNAFVMQFGFDYPEKTIPRPKKRPC